MGKVLSDVFKVFYEAVASRLDGSVFDWHLYYQN